MAIPAHYATEERIAHAFARLNKVGAAQLITAYFGRYWTLSSVSLGQRER